METRKDLFNRDTESVVRAEKIMDVYLESIGFTFVGDKFVRSKDIVDSTMKEVE